MIEDLSIRPTVRAVIRKGPPVRVQVKQRPDGQRDMPLPGGRREPGETMHGCVARECLEEIGVAPVLRDILFVAEVFRVGGDKRCQQTGMLFRGQVPDDYEPRPGTRPDHRQSATAWADPSESGALFRPRSDLALTRADAPVCLGGAAQ
ncbi:ADP-ribose pyrophosphatase YjhB, NUDIX family [Salipiger thiooxidans]|uniref:ADP-ribose pyrophosphatase YjhB, NUDIX family n=1 Tax=Salipiger thiooxidans TaxID=282683 RepID=A0A1G7AWS6_9RHOB|nr:ADP-ribose pyrophosphatase YjhB, NUDIX family [Salipiger thiooxidans]